MIQELPSLKRFFVATTLASVLNVIVLFGMDGWEDVLSRMIDWPSGALGALLFSWPITGAGLMILLAGWSVLQSKVGVLPFSRTLFVVTGGMLGWSMFALGSLTNGMGICGAVTALVFAIFNENWFRIGAEEDLATD